MGKEKTFTKLPVKVYSNFFVFHLWYSFYIICRSLRGGTLRRI